MEEVEEKKEKSRLESYDRYKETYPHPQSVVSLQAVNLSVPTWLKIDSIQGTEAYCRNLKI